MYAQLLTTPLDVIQYSYNIFNTKYSKDTFLRLSGPTDTAQKMKFPIKDFFSKYDQIRSFLWIWSHLLKISLMENFIFCTVWSHQGQAQTSKYYIVFFFYLIWWKSSSLSMYSN